MVVSNSDRVQIRKILNKFKKNKDNDSVIFYNLCFAICAPQTTFKSNRKVIDILIERDFFNEKIPKKELEEIVRPVRFIRKAEYLLLMKEKFVEILNIIRGSLNAFDKRMTIEKMVKGMGMKTTSHFLRNIGIEDLAIIDTHVLKFLKKSLPKSKKEYLELEKEFAKEAIKRGLSIAELDAYIWKMYSNTDWDNFEY